MTRCLGASQPPTDIVLLAEESYRMGREGNEILEHWNLNIMTLALPRFPFMLRMEPGSLRGSQGLSVDIIHLACLRSTPVPSQGRDGLPVSAPSSTHAVSAA